MNKDIIISFWQEIASQQSPSRWTSPDILGYEKSLLAPFFGPDQRVLDLGSGNGDLSRALNNMESELIAVDFMDAYARSFNRSNERFVCSSVVDYQPEGYFDVVLLFGVVPYLDRQEELALYENIRGCMAESGIALIKNQCGIEHELLFEGYSSDLGRDYCSRYPAFDSQTSALREIFKTVTSTKYPSEFNKWENTFHVLFECTV